MSLAKTPAELGLPDKFGEFRSQQLMALERISRSDKKVILLQAPTGSGKTLIMAALGRHLDTQVLYTCHTKQLQGQVMQDFPYAVELKGRANYFCLKSGYTCNECTNERGSSSRLSSDVSPPSASISSINSMSCFLLSLSGIGLSSPYYTTAFMPLDSLAAASF